MDFLEQKGDTMFVRLPQEIDHHHVHSLSERIDGAMIGQCPNKLVFDFSAVRFMDSSGIGLLIGRQRIMQRFGGQVYVQNVQGHIAKLLKLSGIEKMIRKYEEMI